MGLFRPSQRAASAGRPQETSAARDYLRKGGPMSAHERPSPIERRKDQVGKLRRSVRRSHIGITARPSTGTCRSVCEGIVSKRFGYPYRSAGQPLAQDPEPGRAGVGWELWLSSLYGNHSALIGSAVRV
jgi:hypothetical protein